MINLHIIGNTFVDIRIDSHTMHLHHSDCLQIVEFISIVDNRKKIFGQAGPRLHTTKMDAMSRARAEALLHLLQAGTVQI